MLKIRSIVMLTAAGALAACGGSGDMPEDVLDSEVAEVPAGGMDGMQGMDGMEMGGEMMQRMQAHMQMMQGGSGEEMMQMIPQHRPMLANMISQMNREMRDMNMAADEEWNSTIEALRQDLVQMPEMSAAEMESFMPEHRARVMQLMEMHEGMMATM